VRGNKVRVEGRAFDDRDGRIAEVEVAGTGLETDAEGRFALDVVLHPGDNVIRAFAVDAAGNVGRAEVTVRRDDDAPEDGPVPDGGPAGPGGDGAAAFDLLPAVRSDVLEFTRPVHGAVLRERVIRVEGRVLHPRIDVVTLNGAALPADGGVFRTAVELAPGENRLVLEAVTPAGDLAQAAISVFHDPAAPGAGDLPDVDLGAGDPLAGDPGDEPAGAAGDAGAASHSGTPKGSGSVGCATAPATAPGGVGLHPSLGLLRR
jgi:hypothetical protein